MRKKLKNWKRTDEAEKRSLKEQVIGVLVRETDESVSKQIMWLMASMYKQCVRSGERWPELLELVNELTMSADEEKFSRGIAFVDVLVAECVDELKPQLVGLLPVLARVLASVEASSCSLKTKLHAMSSLNHIMPYVAEQELTGLDQLFQLVVDRSLNFLRTCQSDDTVSTLFELYQSLVEYEVFLIHFF